MLTDAARKLAVRAAEAADQIEAEQRLPLDLVDGMRDAGLFQMCFPPSLGGPAPDPVTMFEAVEHLARADASVGWCSMVASTTCYMVGWLDPAVAVELFGSPPDARVSGSTRPLGTATPVAGGYRVRGRWDFISGVRHANYVGLACTLEPAADPPTRVVFVPVEQIEVVPTWDVIGMRGTGSHDVVLHDVFVPEERTVYPIGPARDPSPLYDPRLLRVVTHAPVAAVVLGLAQAMVDGLLDVAGRRTTLNPVALRDRQDVQRATAEAVGRIEAARAFVTSAVDHAWRTVVEGTGDPSLPVATTRLAFFHAAREAVVASDALYAAAGTLGVRRENPLERRLRDLAVARHFPAFDEAVLRNAGRVLHGLAPEGTGW